MKKGSNAYHGSFFTTYEADALDGSQNATLRYDPVPTVLTPDADSQTYVPKRDHFRYNQTGFTVGGPILKDRIWFFLGLAPQYQSTARTVNFGRPFSPCGHSSPSSPTGPMSSIRRYLEQWPMNVRRLLRSRTFPASSSKTASVSIPCIRALSSRN